MTTIDFSHYMTENLMATTKDWPKTLHIMCREHDFLIFNILIVVIMVHVTKIDIQFQILIASGCWDAFGFFLCLSL